MKYTFDDFIGIIRRLRSPGGCPWDREQTHESLRPCMIEEAYEVIDGIDKKDMDNLREELGDVLLQVVMHSVIAEENGDFDISDVVSEISAKMIRRHPHVFANEKAKDSETVLANWEEIKKEEKKETAISQGMERIPKAMPANIRAAKVQKKAARAGFDFASYEEALDKVYEELSELEEARKTGATCEIQEEYGDLMFSIINLSRFLQLNAENSLTNATNKFINRFVSVERLAIEGKQDLSELTIDEMNDLWNRVK